MSPSSIQRIGGFVAAGLVATFLFFSTYFTVAETERTVVTRFGEFVSVEGPGLHFKTPFVNGLHTYYVGVQGVGQKKVNTYTVDNQEVDADFIVNFRIPAESVKFLYQNVHDPEARLASLATDRFKAVMGQANITDLATKRGEVARRVRDLLRADARELFKLEIVDFQITNLEYKQSFRDAVNHAAIAKANVEKAEQEKRQAEVDAEKARVAALGTANAAREAAKGAADAVVFAAEAAAKRITLEAEAQAKAIRLKGEAEAAAIDAQTKALAQSATLIELRKAERWNGALPTSMLSNVMPFLNVDQAVKR